MTPEAIVLWLLGLLLAWTFVVLVFSCAAGLATRTNAFTWFGMVFPRPVMFVQTLIETLHH